MFIRHCDGGGLVHHTLLWPNQITRNQTHTKVLGGPDVNCVPKYTTTWFTYRWHVCHLTGVSSNQTSCAGCLSVLYYYKEIWRWCLMLMGCDCVFERLLWDPPPPLKKRKKEIEKNPHSIDALGQRSKRIFSCCVQECISFTWRNVSMQGCAQPSASARYCTLTKCKWQRLV